MLNESYMRLQENQTLLGQLQTLWLSKPLEVTTFVYDIRCEGYADNTDYGYDDGDGNGTAFDGILHPDEVDGDLFRCIGGVATIGFPHAESHFLLGADHVLIGDQLFFKTNYTLGDELYIYDITAGIQRLVKDIIPGSSGSAPSYLFEHQGIAYFTADDDGTYGRELWRSDGTAIGTYMVKDINPGSSSTYTYEFASVETASTFGQAPLYGSLMVQMLEQSRFLICPVLECRSTVAFMRRIMDCCLVTATPQIMVMKYGFQTAHSKELAC